jgi:N utilization substance protein B
MQLVEFAQTLLSGVRRNRQELDAMLVRCAANWSLERMAVTDRNVIRLGAYEILYTDTPGPVVIDEAVELAKRFGARQSAQFVNGVLDRFLHDWLQRRGETK